MMSVQAAYIDDEQPLLQLAKEFLEGEGDLRLDVFDVVYEAFSALSDKSYDVIVCDYQMPDMDGIQVLRTLRENGERMPFILFTGKGREEVAAEALNLGANRYIQKGGDARAQFLELKHAVLQLCQQTRAEQELEQSNRELEVLFHVAGELMGSTDLERIAAVINRAITQVMRADLVMISSYDEASRTILTDALWRDGRQVDTSRLRPVPLQREGQGTQSRVLRSLTPMIVPDYQALVGDGPAFGADVMVQEPGLGPEEGGKGPGSAVMVPLKNQGGGIGVLSVMSYRTNEFSERHLRFLEPLAGSAAAAISLSRMHQEASLELDRRGQAEHQRLLMEAMMEACENGIMVWHFGPGQADLHPVIWNPAAARLLFGNEGEGFSTLKDCSTLLSQDLDALAREAGRSGRRVDVLVVRQGMPQPTALEISISPLDAEHVGLLIVPR
jgi:CheY-like chemotaxis protein